MDYRLTWSKVIPLTGSPTIIPSKVNGVYIYFLRHKDYHRIIYVGSGNILNEQKSYIRMYRKANTFLLDLNKISSDPYEYMTERRYDINRQQQSKCIYEGGEYKKLNNDEYVHLKSVADNYLANTFISYALIEHDFLRVESIIQKYLINQYKIDWYSKYGNLVGLRRNSSFKEKSGHRVISRFDENDKYWFYDVPDTIVDDKINCTLKQT